MACAGCNQQNRPDPWGWRVLEEPAAMRLAFLMRSWVGTPYVSGERVRHAGVDCWQLGAAILDGMARNPEDTQLRHTAHDAGMNHPAEAMKAVRELMQVFGMEDVTRRRVLEPGDFLAVGSEASTVGSHLLIQSTRQDRVLEAPRRGSRVILTPRGDRPIRRVYRVKDRSAWA